METQSTPGQPGREGMEKARTAARDVTSAAAEAATHRVEGVFETNKAAAVSGLAAVANALRSAADDMEGGLSGSARRAADALERATHAIESRDLDGLVAASQDYARRRRPVFLGASFAAGFALAPAQGVEHARRLRGGPQLHRLRQRGQPAVREHAMSYETRPQMEMSESERSIAELFRNLSRDIGTLLRQESELARTEVRQKAGQVAAAGAALGSGGIVHSPAS